MYGEEKQEQETQILSRKERDSFQGVTLGDQTQESWRGSGFGQNGSAPYGVHFQQLKWSSLGWGTKIMLALLLLALLSGGFILAGGVVVAGAVWWLLQRLAVFRR